MTDKEKIRKKVERLYNQSLADENRQADRGLERAASVSYGKSKACKEILSFIDSMQEEPASKDKFTFTSLPRLLDRIKPTDRVKWYSSRLADALEEEGYITDAKIVRESIKLMNGEKVPMATIDEEPVSEDLEEAAEEYAKKHSVLLGFDCDSEPIETGVDIKKAVIYGAKWQKEHLWKPADGDDLPEIDREVIALIDNGKVVFAHRPNPEGWDAKSIITEKVERYIPETYGKGGWNIPDVKWWLDCLLPNMED